MLTILSYRYYGKNFKEALRNAKKKVNNIVSQYDIDKKYLPDYDDDFVPLHQMYKDTESYYLNARHVYIVKNMLYSEGSTIFLYMYKDHGKVTRAEILPMDEKIYDALTPRLTEFMPNKEARGYVTYDLSFADEVDPDTLSVQLSEKQIHTRYTNFVEKFINSPVKEGSLCTREVYGPVPCDGNCLECWNTIL